MLDTPVLIGLHLCARWLVEAEAGRHINLTVFDFTTVTSSTSDVMRAAAAAAPSVTSAFCRRLTVVRDPDSGQETNICSRAERQQTFASSGHRLEITMATGRRSHSNVLVTMATPSTPNNVYFLIRYEGRPRLYSSRSSSNSRGALGSAQLLTCFSTLPAAFLMLMN